MVVVGGDVVVVVASSQPVSSLQTLSGVAGLGVDMVVGAVTHISAGAPGGHVNRDHDIRVRCRVGGMADRDLVAIDRTWDGARFGGQSGLGHS